jgi:hypothetical protein
MYENIESSFFSGELGKLVRWGRATSWRRRRHSKSVALATLWQHKSILISDSEIDYPSSPYTSHNLLYGNEREGDDEDWERKRECGGEKVKRERDRFF